MNNATAITSPQVRNMRIPFWRYASGTHLCSKRLGMHEDGAKAASCFPEVFGKGACSCALQRPEPLL
jgi:hypothetical protein